MDNNDNNAAAAVRNARIGANADDRPDAADPPIQGGGRIHRGAAGAAGGDQRNGRGGGRGGNGNGNEENPENNDVNNNEGRRLLQAVVAPEPENDDGGGMGQELHPDAGEDEEEDDDGVIDGGVAGAPREASEGDDGKTSGGGADSAGSKRKSTDCELIILVECTEKLRTTGPCSRVGSVVSIGLHDPKTTRLDALFKRYATVASRSFPPGEAPLRFPGDVEFVHHDVLDPRETAEGCALMKNDTIRVRRRRAGERAEAERRERAQRESDRDYLRQLRGLFLESAGANSNRGGGGSSFGIDAGGPNVLLECRPYLEIGQRGVLNHVVKAHECLVSRRCDWLREKIERAKENREKVTQRERPSVVRQQPAGGSRVVFTIPDAPSQGNSGVQPAAGGANGAGGGDEDEDDAIVHYGPAVVPERAGRRRRMDHDRMEVIDNPPSNRDGAQHQVVAEDEDDDNVNGAIVMETGESSPVSGGGVRAGASLEDMIWVPVKDHPPEAVKLLLEYCYTNRVLCLGRDAFQQASKGAVPPHSPSGKWPNRGEPTVSMAVALAGVSLAEAARMPRLSLMCEVAASNLVSNSNVLDALALCTDQDAKTGNRLPILRKKSMAHLLCVPVLKELSHTRKFLRGLEERRDLVVPALLQGTQDISLPPKNKRKGSPSSASGGGFDDPLMYKVDEEDREARNMERLKRRTERQLARSGSGIAPFVWTM